MHHDEQDQHLPMVRIREAAEAADLSPSTLRLYEELGLVLPYRETGGQRLYSLSDIHWLKALQRYFKETRTGPQCVARLLRLIPFQALCEEECRQCPCLYRGHDPSVTNGPCWFDYGTEGERRRECRECPAYQRKHLALNFEQNFVIRRKPAA